MSLPIGLWLTREAEGPVARRGAQIFTQRQWQRAVMGLGHRLLAQPQQKWALCFEDSYLFSIALLAALHAGKIPVIPGHCRESLLQEQSSEFDAVLSDNVLSLACPVILLTADDADEPNLTALPPIDPFAFVVLFTSGSTGTPAQVIKPLRCLDEEVSWLAERWGERLAGCTVIASVSHQHLYGLSFRIFLPLALGLPFDCRQVYYSEQLCAQQPNLKFALISSPAFLRRLDRSLVAPDCRLIVSAGAELPWDCAQEIHAWLKQPVDEIYGSTETGMLATRTRNTERELWQPFHNVAFSQDTQQRWWATSPLIPQEEGLQLDDKLQFVPGGFQLCGRYDRIVKIEDKRVSLSEIERRLLALPQIVDAVALPVSRSGRNGIGVVLVLNESYDALKLMQLKREWRHELHQWLEPVAMPRFWRIVETIPHNSQSKRVWPQIQALFYAAR